VAYHIRSHHYYYYLFLVIRQPFVTVRTEHGSAPQSSLFICIDYVCLRLAILRPTSVVITFHVQGVLCELVHKRTW